MLRKYNNIYNDFLDLSHDLEEYQKRKIPLCAAETYISSFVKYPLSSEFEGKYCMGNLKYEVENDFIGGEYIHRLFELLNQECSKVFKSKYADARTLSGLNCLQITIASLLKNGSKVLITGPNQGGHPSLKLILDLYNIEIKEIPYDYKNYDIDYDALNKLLADDEYDAIIFCQSDLLIPADVSRIDDYSGLIIYDATQTMGMITAGIHKNPLLEHKNVVVIGGTHKTLPGPTCGLIMCNDDELAKILDYKISPSYLRNVQPNNIASLLLALIEQEKIGKEYQSKIIENANLLADKLIIKGFNIAKIGANVYTKTHQIFILTTKEKMLTIYKNARKYGITLNKKVKELFNGFGIRIGLQEVTRYGYNELKIELLAELLYQISFDNVDEKKVLEIINILNKNKENAYVVS